VAALMEAFMLPAGGTQPGSTSHRLALWHPPQGRLRNLVLFAHPLAEEMNKSRRMVALQARALAEQGHGVLQVDLLGCGDSAGDFGDATWAHWVDDLLQGARWLRQQGTVPLTLWGLRTGCLLQAAAAAQWPEACNFLFWQPAASGAMVLRQFLRTAAASAMLDGGGKGVVESLRQELAAGRPVEVGGYRINPALALGLEQARLLPPRRAGHVLWVDLASQVSEGPASPSPATMAATAPWQAVAASLNLYNVPGPPFWQTAEIEIAPRLLARTLSLVNEPAFASGAVAHVA
jgi:exosortase A-associated hydrolase 2